MKIKSMKRYLLITALMFLMLAPARGQELRCNISVSSERIQGANRNLFYTMQADLYEFMNNRRWTEHAYTMDERIECSIFIRLDEQISADEFRGSIQVQVKRPVFNSSYETTVLNIKDNDFQCKYVEFQPIEFNETSNRDNLTNIMAYYAYVILGFDYDSYSREGELPISRRPRPSSTTHRMPVKRGGSRSKTSATVTGSLRIS